MAKKPDPECLAELKKLKTALDKALQSKDKSDILARLEDIVASSEHNISNMTAFFTPIRPVVKWDLKRETPAETAQRVAPLLVNKKANSCRH